MVLAALLFIRKVAKTTTVSQVTKEYVEEGATHILQDKHIPDYVTVVRIHGPFLFGATDKLSAVIEHVGRAHAGRHPAAAEHDGHRRHRPARAGGPRRQAAGGPDADPVRRPAAAGQADGAGRVRAARRRGRTSCRTSTRPGSRAVLTAAAHRSDAVVRSFLAATDESRRSRRSAPCARWFRNSIWSSTISTSMKELSVSNPFAVIVESSTDVAASAASPSPRREVVDALLRLDPLVEMLVAGEYHIHAVLHEQRLEELPQVFLGAVFLARRIDRMVEVRESSTSASTSRAHPSATRSAPASCRCCRARRTRRRPC